jgi:hypothetical protein
MEEIEKAESYTDCKQLVIGGWILEHDICVLDDVGV